ncbi:hypothetical protein TIFTF001_025267 [Ficus carica]|uniref:Uncharacterized protein n=1 Tax=Ficus carica TaxID=3494 RepID=A0AA88AYN9_FICCA|nr:hypothetical protein TIFTF001_025267 [Ficus carica]
MMSAHSFGKGRHSWTFFGNPYLFLIRAKSSSMKMERWFAIRNKDYVLIRCGGLLNRGMVGMERALAPDTITGIVLRMMIIEHSIENHYSIEWGLSVGVKPSPYYAMRRSPRPLDQQTMSNKPWPIDCS